MRALDVATGEQRWSVTFRIGTDSTGGTPPSPLASDGTVYVVGETAVYALDAVTGDERWRSEPGGTLDLSRTALADGTVRVNVDGALYALDAATGDEKWAADTGRRVTIPAVADGPAGDDPGGGRRDGLHRPGAGSAGDQGGGRG